MKRAGQRNGAGLTDTYNKQSRSRTRLEIYERREMREMRGRKREISLEKTLAFA